MVGTDALLPYWLRRNSRGACRNRNSGVDTDGFATAARLCIFRNPQSHWHELASDARCYAEPRLQDGLSRVQE